MAEHVCKPDLKRITFVKDGNGEVFSAFVPCDCGKQFGFGHLVMAYNRLAEIEPLARELAEEWYSEHCGDCHACEASRKHWAEKDCRFVPILRKLRAAGLLPEEGENE